MKYVIAIVGPTAIGKSKLAIELALKYKGEIISADSRQIYRHLDIGTAKPYLQDQKKIPHHLIDIISPDQPFSLGLYKNLVSKKIKEIHKRVKIPFLVGGSGLYVWSILENWQIPEVAPDMKFRNTLQVRAEKYGYQNLFNELIKLDPEASSKISPTNIRRVIRALEIHYKSGGKASQQLTKKLPAEYSSFIIGLTTDRKLLYDMIDKRVETMIELGLVEEVRNLLDSGYDYNLPAMSGIGYKQILMYLKDVISLEEAIAQIKMETHRFARRQYSWFRLNDTRINWFDVRHDITDNINRHIEDFLIRQK